MNDRMNDVKNGTGICWQEKAKIKFIELYMEKKAKEKRWKIVNNFLSLGLKMSKQVDYIIAKTKALAFAAKIYKS